MAFPQRKRTPSFSSSVLDSIYRSIDESDGPENNLRRSINVNNDNVSSSSSPNKKDDNLTTLRRVIMDDEHWLYAQSSTTNSSSTFAFSSSEAESYREKRRSRKLVEQGNRSSDDKQRTKRTSVMDKDKDKKHKALKMLEEIKRPKQPVSPGARLTSFLNSIFQSNAKKVKLCSVDKITDVKSSSSRSCFSRARCKADTNNCNNLKKSARFYPVRVTIEGDCRDSVQKNTTREKKPILQCTVKKSVGRVKTSPKEDIKNNVHKSELTCVARKFCLKDFVRSCRYEGEEEEDDVWSYSSSDLFELDNHRIGMGRYVKELPLYETTDLKTNQAIARGLLL